MKLKSALTFSLLALGTATAIQAQEVKLNIPGQPAAAAACLCGGGMGERAAYDGGGGGNNI